MMEQRNAFEVIAETLSMSEELAALRAKLATAQARIAELEAAPAGQWQPVEEGDDGCICLCEDDDCTLFWYISDDGFFVVEDGCNPEQHMHIDFGEDYMLMRRTEARIAARVPARAKGSRGVGEMENKSMLSLMAAAEALGSRSALLQVGVSISADASSLSAERAALTDEFKRREAELHDLRIRAGLGAATAQRWADAPTWAVGAVIEVSIYWTDYDPTDESPDNGRCERDIVSSAPYQRPTEER